MLTWYDRHIILQRYPELNKEAGTKENVFFALLTMLMTGIDLKVVHHVSTRTGAPVEQISRPAEDPIWEDIRRLIRENEENPKVQELLRRSKELAAEVEAGHEPDTEPDKMSALPEESSPNRTFTDIDDSIVEAVIAIEGASPTHVGPAGDTGVMQLLPGTWEEMNRTYFHGKYPYSKFGKNRSVNIMMGKQYLQHLQKWLNKHQARWKGDPLFLLFAAYNGGIGNVMKNDFDPEKIKVRMPRVYDYATRALALTTG